MEHTKAGILCGCIEQMAADAEDKGKDSFGINLSLEDSRIITKTLFNADRYRWHDLRKNPDDLPETIPSGAGTTYSEALIVWTDNRKAITAIYDGKGFVGDAEFWEAERETIIAWKYAEPFKEEA